MQEKPTKLKEFQIIWNLVYRIHTANYLIDPKYNENLELGNNEWHLVPEKLMPALLAKGV